jgi:hypothetical protein
MGILTSPDNKINWGKRLNNLYIIEYADMKEAQPLLF